MKIVFMGTPIFATSILKKLITDGYQVIGVVSQPDKKVGRKQVITTTPVSACAKEYGIEVYQPVSIREGLEKIANWNPELIVTCAYGQMIPESILSYPKYGCLNVHASLLPKLRGGAPIHKAIINNEKETGVSIMRMVKQMDAGDYMLQEKVLISLDDTMSSLHDKLMVAGAIAISKAIKLLISEKAVFIKQQEEEATFAYNISKEEEYIDANRDVIEVYNHIRGLIAWPIGYIVVQDKKIKLHQVRLGENTQDYEIGTLFKMNKKLYLQCLNGVIELIEVQLEGKAKCKAIEFINGYGQKFIK